MGCGLPNLGKRRGKLGGGGNEGVLFFVHTGTTYFGGVGGIHVLSTTARRNGFCTYKGE